MKCLRKLLLPRESWKIIIFTKKDKILQLMYCCNQIVEIQNKFYSNRCIKMLHYIVTNYISYFFAKTLHFFSKKQNYFLNTTIKHSLHTMKLVIVFCTFFVINTDAVYLLIQDKNRLKAEIGRRL